jgi:hypothetical protein
MSTKRKYKPGRIASFSKITGVNPNTACASNILGLKARHKPARRNAAGYLTPTRRPERATYQQKTQQ